MSRRGQRDKKWSKEEPFKKAGNVSDYSLENASHEEPLVEPDEPQDKQSEIDHEDREVLLRLVSRLNERGELDLGGISIEIENGAVILRGKVTSNAAKMEISEIAEAIPGVREVENRIEIETR